MITVVYSAGGRTGSYKVWQHSSKMYWMWEALGSGGREKSEEEAVESAKYWIKYGKLRVSEG